MAIDRFRFLLAMGAVILAVPGMAHAQQDLAIEADKAWTHKHSGISVPPSLGGIRLTKAKTYATDELDVSLSFEPAGTKDFISFYVFRNTNGSAPVWFSQAQLAIETRGTFGTPVLASPVRAFAPPGHNVASGLRAVYAPQRGAGFTSTGVALIPVNDWYAKLRITSEHLSPAELEALMDKVIAEIQWLGQSAAAQPSLPVIACPAPLTFPKKSKDVRGKGMNAALSEALLAATGSLNAPDRKNSAATAPVQWCLDKHLGGATATYRPDASVDHYLMAMGDNGNGAWVGLSASNAIMAEMEGKRAKPTYGVTLLTAAENFIFVPQDRLPSPDRVRAIVNAGRYSSSVTSWGKDIGIKINGGPQ